MFTIMCIIKAKDDICIKFYTLKQCFNSKILILLMIYCIYNNIKKIICNYKLNKKYTQQDSRCSMFIYNFEKFQSKVTALDSISV